MDTLDLMRTFLAVVETEGFTAAGRKLGRSKALVSKHVSELEARLGVRLLQRTTRQLGLTETGRAYFERARELLADVEDLEASMRAQAENPRGLLKITAPQSLGELALMGQIAAFKARFPAIEIDILLTDRMVDLVAEGFDLAIRISALEDSSLISRRLCQTRLLLCASPGYLKAFGSPRTPEEITKHRIIFDSNASKSSVWRYKLAGSQAAGLASLKLRPCLTVNGATAVRQLLLAGLGIGVIPEFAVAQDIAHGRLEVLLPDAFSSVLIQHIVYPNRLHLSPKVRAFIDFSVAWFDGGTPRAEGADPMPDAVLKRPQTVAP